MEVVTRDVDRRHFLVADHDALGIDVGVEFAVHLQAGARCRAGDQLDDGLVADQRPGPPVLADEGEQPVLDLVPLAGPGGQVGDDDLKAGLTRQYLQLEQGTNRLSMTETQKCPFANHSV